MVCLSETYLFYIFFMIIYMLEYVKVSERAWRGAAGKGRKTGRRHNPGLCLGVWLRAVDGFIGGSNH